MQRSQAKVELAREQTKQKTVEKVEPISARTKEMLGSGLQTLVMPPREELDPRVSHYRIYFHVDFNE
jgi:hypothetical protein